MTDIDTTNRLIIGARGDHLIAVHGSGMFGPLTPTEAVVAAAWLVLLAQTIDPDVITIEQAVAAVGAT